MLQSLLLASRFRGYDILEAVVLNSDSNSKASHQPVCHPLSCKREKQNGQVYDMGMDPSAEGQDII